MEQDWVDRFLEQRQARREAEQQRDRMDVYAMERTSDMFKRLYHQLKKDIQTYELRTGNHIDITAKESAMAFEIQTHGFPNVFMRFNQEQGAIRVMKSVTRDNSADSKMEPSVIEIVGKEQGKVVYRIGGADVANESEVSEMLLLPIFEMFPPGSA